jgi:hypothetical protein
MKKVSLFLITLMIALSVGFYSCVSDDDVVSLNELNKVDSEVLLSNSKFSCYEMSGTRSEGKKVLIKVHDLSNVDIIFEENDEINKDGYLYKSVFYKDGKELFVLYSNVEEKDNGYLLSYKYSYGDMDNFFLPKQISRGWGEDTMGCLSDAYTNHGWASVWVTIQTAFIPETAVAFAAACAIKNY